MSYPVWEVPNIGNGWIIGLIAIFHVFISHFAIGGGAFLALTETLALKKTMTAFTTTSRSTVSFSYC
jgi:cytochrome bd ubiquinol oxidase subunit I